MYINILFVRMVYKCFYNYKTIATYQVAVPLVQVA